MVSQIISGIIVAVVSFFFGYLLFVVKRKEAIRLELFRKRLNSYDNIMAFMQKIDQEIIAKNFSIDKNEKEAFVQEIYNLTLPNKHYLSKKVFNLLEPDLVECIDELPETSESLEGKCEHIKSLIQDEIGSYIITPKHVRKIVGSNKEKDPILEHYENQ